jgi:predicted lactoylglutathione lyase
MVDTRDLEPRISLITLATDDLGRARAFYAAMGWVEAPVSNKDIAFFQMLGQALALYPRADLERDTGRPARGGGVTLAQNLRSRAEVDALHARALAAGAEDLSRPTETAWGGYVAYVADPEGHVWEFAHVPMFPLAPDGALSLTGDA